MHVHSFNLVLIMRVYNKIIIFCITFGLLLVFLKVEILFWGVEQNRKIGNTVVQWSVLSSRNQRVSGSSPSSVYAPGQGRVPTIIVSLDPGVDHCVPVGFSLFCHVGLYDSRAYPGK